MTTDLDMDALKDAVSGYPNVILAALFGSARDGLVRQGSDVDLGVLLAPPLSAEGFLEFASELGARLRHLPFLDVVDLNHADSILAFEALQGRKILVRDPDAVAAFASLAARQYENDMARATREWENRSPSGQCRKNAAVTSELVDVGIALMRQNLRRRHPAAAESEIEALLRDWMCRADDPLPGDTAGAVRVRERAS